MVFRLLCLILLAVMFTSACRDELKTKEKVQQAIMDRLQSHSGLDLKALDVTTTDVNFEKNKATATMAFHPKGDLSVNGGMTMKYNLEERDGKWVVTGINNSQGSPMGVHPPVSGANPAGDALPPGHSSVSGPAK